MGKVENVDQLRHGIDQGGTGDKVASSDPAAAPLGTDAEAGGVSPTKAEVALDAAASKTRQDEHREPRSGPLIYIGLVLIVVAAILGVLVLLGPGAGT